MLAHLILKKWKKRNRRRMMSFYHRRSNKVNVAGIKDEDESLAQMLAKFCKRCGHELIWSEDIANLFCPVCAWEPPAKKKEKTEKLDVDKVYY